MTLETRSVLTTLLLLVSLTESTSAQARKNGVTLVMVGKPCAVLVVPKGTSKADRRWEDDVFPAYDNWMRTPETGWVVRMDPALAAAQVLQEYIHRMTGTFLPIVESGATGVSRAIVLSERCKETGISAKELTDLDLGYDGFVIRSRSDRITLAGRRPESLLFAAFALLEKLGCRFYLPYGEEGEEIPQRTSLAAPHLNHVSKPSFEHRWFWQDGWIRRYSTITPLDQSRWRRWLLQNRLGGKSYTHVHAFGYICPPDSYSKSHPEYFALTMQKSGRLERVFEGQICISHPQVINMTVQKARKHFDANGPEATFALSANDAGGWCECEQCLEWDSPFPGERDPTPIPNRRRPDGSLSTNQLYYRNMEFFGRGLHNRMARFVNAVAEETAKTHPKNRFVYHAQYGSLREPPVGFKLHPNVIPMLVNEKFCTLHSLSDPACTKNGIYRESLNKWTSIAKQSAVYEYHGFSYVPTPMIHSVGPRIREFARTGVRGYWAELASHSLITDLSLYVTAKLLWDPTIDWRALLQEFYQRYYKDAAHPMEAYFTTEARVAQKAPCHYGLIPSAYAPEDLQACTRHLEKAEQLAHGPVVKRRVLRAREQFQATALSATAWHAHTAWKRAWFFAPDRSEVRREPALALANQALTYYASLSQKYPISKPFLEYGLESFRSQLESGRPRLDESASLEPGYSDQETFGDLWDEYEEVGPVPMIWRFSRDLRADGERQGWQQADFNDTGWDPIRIAEFAEAQGYDFGSDYGHHVAWYRVDLPVPAQVSGEQLFLYFGAVDESAWVYLNGRLVGVHDEGIKGWDRRFRVDISRVVRPGQRNVLAIRVLSRANVGGIWKSVKLLRPRTRL